MFAPSLAVSSGIGHYQGTTTAAELVAGYKRVEVKCEYGFWRFKRLFIRVQSYKSEWEYYRVIILEQPTRDSYLDIGIISGLLGATLHYPDYYGCEGFAVEIDVVQVGVLVKVDWELERRL
jgi:hypothetical protein